MANLNVYAFSEDFRDKAPKECALFLVECLYKKKKAKLKEDWNNAGGYKVIPWWKWCLDKIDVSYCKKKGKGK